MNITDRDIESAFKAVTFKEDTNGLMQPVLDVEIMKANLRVLIERARQEGYERGLAASAPPSPDHDARSLRDYFAAKALSGAINCLTEHPINYEAWAREAYKLADAMLKARAKEKE